MKNTNQEINQNIMAGNELATAEQLAQICKVSRRTVDNWTSRRTIPYIKIGAAVRFYVPKVMHTLSKFEVSPI